MEFIWDENKRQSNLNKHDLDFREAFKLFDGETLTFEDNRFDYCEQRLITMGMLNTTVVVIVHTETIDQIRIISMRRATSHEQKLYFRNIYG